MTSKLALFNKAAVNLSQERISALTDNVLIRRSLDAVYDDTLNRALEMGLWLWALRTINLSYDPDIDTSSFGGLAYGFTLPDDFVRIAAIAIDPYFNSELTDYELTGPGRTLYSDQSEIYLKYVSNGATYGLDLGSWPETFADGVGHLLASAVAMTVTKSRTDRDDEAKAGEIAITRAKIRSAVDERVKVRPVGRLIRARLNSSARVNRSLSDF